MGGVTVEPPFAPEDLAQVLGGVAGLGQDLREKHLLITGGTGFFGRWLLESLLAANSQNGANLRATVLARNPAAFLARVPHLAAAGAISWVKGSVTTIRPEDFAGQRFDGVIHLATEADSQATVSNPAGAIEVITDGTRRMLDVALGTGAGRFLFTSSGSVYGKQPPTLERVGESFPGVPDANNLTDAYAISGEAKRRAEQLCEAYARDHKLATVIARGFTFAGPGMPLDGKFAFGNFIHDALAGRPIVLTGDGTPVRSYLHAIDFTIWLWTMLVRGTSGRAYNLGSEHPVTLRELAHAIAGEFGLADVRVMQAAKPGQSSHRYVPSTARAQVELGLQQTVDLESAIRRSANWWRRGVQR